MVSNRQHERMTADEARTQLRLINDRIAELDAEREALERLVKGWQDWLAFDKTRVGPVRDTSEVET
jgi:hypothetical protein